MPARMEVKWFSYIARRKLLTLLGKYVAMTLTMKAVRILTSHPTLRHVADSKKAQVHEAISQGLKSRKTECSAVKKRPGTAQHTVVERSRPVRRSEGMAPAYC